VVRAEPRLPRKVFERQAGTRKPIDPADDPRHARFGVGRQRVRFPRHAGCQSHGSRRQVHSHFFPWHRGHAVIVSGYGANARDERGKIAHRRQSRHLQADVAPARARIGPQPFEVIRRGDRRFGTAQALSAGRRSRVEPGDVGAGRRRAFQRGARNHVPRRVSRRSDSTDQAPACGVARARRRRSEESHGRLLHRHLRHCRAIRPRIALASLLIQASRSMST
jgi:hypothetical protein